MTDIPKGMTHGPPPLPERLRSNLTTFRSRMRRAKIAEGLFVALIALFVSYLAVAGLDRLVETHALARAGLFLAALALTAIVVPKTLRRWYWRHRDLRQVASEITVKDAGVGDRLLGVFDLTRDEAEYRRSPELVRAAVQQGENDLGGRDLSYAQPPSRHRALGAALLVPVAATAVFAAVFPTVAKNALLRWSNPFGDVERYTFARLDGLQAEWYVPVQETRQVELALADTSRTQPATAQLRWSHGVAEAPLVDGTYRLDVPPLGVDETALLVVGDVREEVELLPRERPEVVAANATVTLPAYLELPEPLQRDVRGGSLSVVEGSDVAVGLEFTRELNSASIASTQIEPPREVQPPSAAGPVDAETIALDVSGNALTTATLPFPDDVGRGLDLEWVDIFGLEGHGPFHLGVRPRPDEAPVVALSGVEREMVLLESVALTFDVIATDDFGVRRVGLEWRTVGRFGQASEDPVGEKVLIAGEPDADRLEAFAAFRPKDVGLTSGEYELAGWAIDALPGRERAMSAPIRVRVMTADEHMEWVTARLDRWTQRAIEVRDREMELLAENKSIHALTNAELDEPGTRSRIENQARAERSNRARLQSLVGQGKDMLAEAARNPEFGSNVLDDWAESMSKLEDIANTQMSSVADLLQKAARSEPSEGGKPKDGEQPKMIGEDRGSLAGGPPPPEDEGEDEGDGPVIPPTPSIVDMESALAKNEMPDEAAEPQKPSNSQQPAPLGLVATTLGAAPPPEDSGEAEGPDVDPPIEEEEPSMTKEELAAAIAAQEALLVAFNEVAGEIQDVLANLENSTFVRRLKSASRAQGKSARDLDVAVERGFGSVVATANDTVAKASLVVNERREVELPKLTDLHGDLDAYLDRLESKASGDVPKFQRVLDEWNDLRPTLLADQLVDEAENGRPGEARASADFLSDTLDRWGEELVGPG